MCVELEEGVGAGNWLDMVILYYQKFSAEHQEFAMKVNRLVGVVATKKIAVFFIEVMNKEGFREWQLRDLEKEARERALEIEMFIQKLMHDASS
ncbi:hypothetical protein Tco_0490397 [Tanacetum coccineum]